MKWAKAAVLLAGKPSCRVYEDNSEIQREIIAHQLFKSQVDERDSGKKIENHAASVAVFYMDAPSDIATMAAGVTDHVWELADRDPCLQTATAVI